MSHKTWQHHITNVVPTGSKLASSRSSDHLRQSSPVSLYSELFLGGAVNQRVQYHEHCIPTKRTPVNILNATRRAWHALVTPSVAAKAAYVHPAFESFVSFVQAGSTRPGILRCAVPPRKGVRILQHSHCWTKESHQPPADCDI